jgi:hypothetical protein
MRKLLILAMLCGLIGGSASAQRAMDDYNDVRNQMIRQGYHPLNLRGNAVSDQWPCGNGYCRRFPEVIDCRGTGSAGCWFAFYRPADRSYRVVKTLGEWGLVFERMEDPAGWVEAINAFRPKLPPAGKAPAERHYEHYPQVRARLIGQGYQPLKLAVVKDKDVVRCAYDQCAQHPEILGCPLAVLGDCAFGFFNPVDRQYYVVKTFNYPSLLVEGVGKADAQQLAFIKSRLPAGKR